MSFALGLLTYALDRPIGGIGSYTRALIHGLAGAGVAPLLLKAGRLAPGEAGVGLPGSARVPGLLTLGQLQIARHARRLGLDLVHDPTGTFPLALAGCKKVVTVCDVFPYVTPKTSTALEKLVFRAWLPIALRLADAVITISDCSKNDIAQYLPVPKEKIFVTPISNSPAYRPLPAEAVQPVLAKLSIPTPYILYVGSLEPRKNLVRLLQAYARLRQHQTQQHLVIVGARNFWKNAPVVETVAALDLKDWVHFTGFVAEEDLPALYNGADVFVFPSLYEGFGLPPLEAMACGTPVVTSNSSSLPEVVGDAALTVDPYDVWAIAAAMETILANPALAADLRQRGLARASEFSWERMAQETIDVYKRVLNK
jgi:glycosyltransferase involved in cell wall biosynthesis